jgi:hypothetical protein
VIGDVVSPENSSAIESRALRAFDANAGAIVVVVDRQLAWFEAFVAELSHDRPLDSAVGLADQNAVVIGSTRFLNATAVRTWAFHAANQIERVARDTADNLRAIGLSQPFDHEHEGGLTTARLVTAFEGDHGLTVEIHSGASLPGSHRSDSVDRGSSAKPPGEPNREAPTAGTIETRRLIADVWDRDQRCDGVIPPLKSLSLVIRIGIPLDGETAADVPFPYIDTDETSAELEAVVRGDVWPSPQRAELRLPMTRRDVDSTAVAFAFSSPGEGAAIEFDITILYRGRPLHSASYTASVRTQRFPVDRIHLLTYALSSPAVPTAHASIAAISLATSELTLDGGGAELRDVYGRGSVPLSEVKDILKAIETVSSQELGHDDAPDTISDPRATKLLVKLARLGVDLYRLFKDFGLPDAQSVSLMVGPQTAILPLELIYVRPAPEGDARLCDHVRNPLTDGVLCDLANAKIVCPYAFWGSQRTVHRTIRFVGERSMHDPLPLPLGSILYAASVRADSKSVGVKPSDTIERAAKELFGPQAVSRVQNWRDWKKSIRDVHPTYSFCSLTPSFPNPSGR